MNTYTHTLDSEYAQYKWYSYNINIVSSYIHYFNICMVIVDIHRYIYIYTHYTESRQDRYTIVYRYICIYMYIYIYICIYIYMYIHIIVHHYRWILCTLLWCILHNATLYHTTLHYTTPCHTKFFAIPCHTILYYSTISQMLHVWNIYLHLP